MVTVGEQQGAARIRPNGAQTGQRESGWQHQKAVTSLQTAQQRGQRLGALRQQNGNRPTVRQLLTTNGPRYPLGDVIDSAVGKCAIVSQDGKLIG